MRTFDYPIRPTRWTPPRPADALPGLVGRMCRELSAQGLHPAITIPQVNAFVALLTQALADVGWSNGQRLAIGAHAFVAMTSSGGKSLLFRHLMPPIRHALSMWARTHPHPKILPAFFAADSTREGLVKQVLEWKSVGLFTDEGGKLKQLAKRAPSTLANLMDGDTIDHSRVGTGRVQVDGHRLTVLATEQPGTDGFGVELFRGANAAVGLVNRMFVAEVPADLPYVNLRNVRWRDDTQQAYDKRATELIERSIEHILSSAERPVLSLEPVAEECLTTACDELQRRLTGHPRERELRPYVARHEERVRKLAGAYHVFEHGPEGEISLDLVRAADELGRRSIDEFERMSFVPPKPSQAEVDVQRLAEALRQIAVSQGIWALWLADARRYAMNIGLTKARFNQALAELGGRGMVLVAPQEKKDVLYVQQALLSMSLPM